MRWKSEVRWLDPSDRRWAVGSNPARLVHRMVGHWPGNGAVETACGNAVSLHVEAGHDGWELDRRTGRGRSYGSIELVPSEFVVCLKCVAEDDTVE